MRAEHRRCGTFNPGTLMNTPSVKTVISNFQFQICLLPTPSQGQGVLVPDKNCTFSVPRLVLFCATNRNVHLAQVPRSSTRNRVCQPAHPPDPKLFSASVLPCLPASES